jgi:hypothetical protein
MEAYKMNIALFSSSINQLSEEEKINFFVDLAYDWTINTRSLYEIKESKDFLILFNEVQHRIIGHIANKLKNEKFAQSDWQIIEALIKGAEKKHISSAIYNSLKNAAKKNHIEI